MKVVLLVSLLTVWGLVGSSSPAHASPERLGLDRTTGDYVTELRQGVEPRGPAPREQARPVADAPPTVVVRTFRALDDGTYCEGRRTLIVPEGSSERDLIELHNRSVFQAIDRTDPERFVGRCPNDPTDPVPPVTPDDVVAVLEGQLDRPEPRVEPGFALAGLRMYLETDRALAHRETISVEVAGVSVGIEVDATAS